MIAMCVFQGNGRRFSGRILQCGSGINQPSIKKDPFVCGRDECPIRKCYCGGTSCKSGKINPGKRRSMQADFLGDNTASRLFDNGETSTREFGEQCGLPAARAARNDDKMLHFPTPVSGSVVIADSRAG